MTNKDKLLDAEALAFHANDRPGKFQIAATKPLTSQHDLSLAYSPGVAAPCRKIAGTSIPHMITQTKAIKSL